MCYGLSVQPLKVMLKKSETFFFFYAYTFHTFGEGNGNPLQYSGLENPMDRGAWWATVHRLQRVGHDSTTSLSLSYIWEA